MLTATSRSYTKRQTYRTETLSPIFVKFGMYDRYGLKSNFVKISSVVLLGRWVNYNTIFFLSIFRLDRFLYKVAKKCGITQWYAFWVTVIKILVIPVHL